MFWLIPPPPPLLGADPTCVWVGGVGERQERKDRIIGTKNYTTMQVLSNIFYARIKKRGRKKHIMEKKQGERKVAI